MKQHYNGKKTSHGFTNSTKGSTKGPSAGIDSGLASAGSAKYDGPGVDMKTQRLKAERIPSA